MNNSPIIESGKEALKDTLAVMVCYRTAISRTPTLNTLRHTLQQTSVPDFLFYDNSPEPMYDGQEDLTPIACTTYWHDPTNPGVSKAYNTGAKVARDKGKKWLLLLDQDTSFPENAFELYAKAINDHPDSVLIAPSLSVGEIMVSPCRYTAGFGWPLKSKPVGRFSLQGHSILNSGMLIRLDAFEAIGGFDERIPLDFADHDFCRRFASRFGEAYILDMDCTHGFSDREETPLASALARFVFFCQGARNSIRTPFDLLTYPAAALVRCMILSFRYRTGRFLPVFWQGMAGRQDA